MHIQPLPLHIHNNTNLFELIIKPAAMAEIVAAEPIHGNYVRRSSAAAGATSMAEHVHVPEPFDSEKLPVTLVSEIRKFLRVANTIELEEPRVSYLCRFHAFEIAHNIDRNSSARGVRQFKTSLLQRLEQDEEATLKKRKEKSDIREIKRVYHEYKEYIIKHGATCYIENRDMINARAIASVLFEVLITVSKTASSQALADRESFREKSELYVPYNILPLDPGSAQQAIMQLPEVKAAVAALRNTRGLPIAEGFQIRRGFDLFDWLKYCFGFQEGNVANQREHLILLLANTHIRETNKKASLSKSRDGAMDKLMRSFLKNYTTWCKFLGKKSNIRISYVQEESQQYKLLYIGLYLLIWGEAANLRFMPECLCYIFHHMAYELHGMLNGTISLATWEEAIPAYEGGSETFLVNVVTPIYKVIYKEAEKSKHGADYSEWRNYDDLNEYFWSPDCFQIGWPMKLDHNFFCVKFSKDTTVKQKRKKEENEDEELGEEDEEQKWLGKTNFVEVRSFWQIFRSFDRMWSFFILSLQAMIIIACHDLGSPIEVFDANIFEEIMSIFITSAVLKLIQAILDIAFTWKARYTMNSSQKLKPVLKLGIASIWIIVLPVCYATSRTKYKCYSTRSGSWVGEWCFSSYMIAVAFYLMMNAVEMVLFFVPVISKYIEISNWRICRILIWWTQPRLYVGRGMQESQVSLSKYTVFWVLVLVTKFLFSYFFEIKPLIAPTKQIMKIGVKNYDWHELFPKVNNNAGAVLAVWVPIIIVYFMDTQIWYSVYCTIFGGVYGILHHLGEIRTLGMLRSRFHSLPSAFNVRLIPPFLKKDQETSRKQFVLKRLKKTPENDKEGFAKFVLVWNQIIESFRLEDLISNREMELMKIPRTSGLFSSMVRWPIFLLVNKH